VAVFGFFCRLFHQLDQPLAGVLAVFFLGAKPPRIDNENAVSGDPAAAQAQKPPANILGQRSRIDDIESQLDRGRYAVDVLAAGAGGSDEILLDFVFIQSNVLIYPNHSEFFRKAIEKTKNMINLHLY